MQEVEVLTGVGTILIYTDILLGVEFGLSDHKKRIHLLNESRLSDIRPLWLEKVYPTAVDLHISYVYSRSVSVVEDALSREDFNYLPGTERARAVLVIGYHILDVADDDTVALPVGNLQERPDVETQPTIDWKGSGLMSRPSKGNQWDRQAYTYFVLKCLAGRKEGGSTSKISRSKISCANKANNADRSTEVKAVTVTVTAKSEVLTRTSSKADTPEPTFTALVSHFQSDGSTRRVKYTISNTLCQRINQIWVSKRRLPGFPIGSVKFYMPRFTTWASASTTEHPSALRKLAQQKKLVFRPAHDSSMVVCAKQTRDINQELGLEVVSSNFRDPIRLSMCILLRLILKTDPHHKIINDFGYLNTYFQHELPPLLEKCGVYDSIFRAFLLFIHISSDDCLFSGHRDNQFNSTESTTDGLSGEWAVNWILDPARSKTDTIVKTPLLKGAGSHPEDDPQLIMGSSTLNQSTCLPSPSLDIIFLCLPTTAVKTFITTFLAGSILKLRSSSLPPHSGHFPFLIYIISFNLRFLLLLLYSWRNPSSLLQIPNSTTTHHNTPVQPYWTYDHPSKRHTPLTVIATKVFRTSPNLLAAPTRTDKPIYYAREDHTTGICHSVSLVLPNIILPFLLFRAPLNSSRLCLSCAAKNDRYYQFIPFGTAKQTTYHNIIHITTIHPIRNATLIFIIRVQEIRVFYSVKTRFTRSPGMEGGCNDSAFVRALDPCSQVPRLCHFAFSPYLLVCTSLCLYSYFVPSLHSAVS